MKHVLLVELV